MSRYVAALAALLLWLGVGSPARAQATAAVPGADLRISVLTFGPGAIYWERFGHNAILVRDLSTGSAIAYNYGIFDFSQKNFFLNFARGYMTYRIAADPLAYDLAMYQQAGRSVTEQQLDLNPAQRQRLSDFLRWNARPENAKYRYDYFVSNCSTRVRDALNQVLGGRLQTQLQTQPAPAGHTYRFDAVRLITPDLWLALAMDIALGPVADHPLNLWQESFVPQVFSRALNSITIPTADGQAVPLVTSETMLIPGRLPAAPTRPPHLLVALLLIGLGFAAVLLILGRMSALPARIGFFVVACGVSLVCGVGGLILATLWAFTQHWAGWHNENLLLFDPLTLLLLPAWFAHLRGRTASTTARQIARFISLLAALSLVTRLIPSAYQHNLHWIALLLPIHLALSLRATSPHRRH